MSTTPNRIWRRKAESAASALTLAAAAIAMPRNARALEAPPPTNIAREATSSQQQQRRAAQEKPLAFLGFGRRHKKGTLKAPLAEGELPADTLDMDAIVPAKVAKKFTERKFIFSDELSSKSDLATELEELDEVKNERAFEKTASMVSTYAIAAGGVYLTVKGITSIERWMKQQELDDIEQEREVCARLARPRHFYS